MFTIYIDMEWIVGVVGVVVFLTLATARTGEYLNQPHG